MTSSIINAQRPKVKPVQRFIIYRDGEQVSGEMFPSNAQTCIFVMEQLKPQYKWTFEEITVEPTDETSRE